MKAVDELTEQRELTQEFVSANPTSIPLHRVIREPDGMGGTQTRYIDRDPQDFAVVRYTGGRDVPTEEGSISTHRIELVGVHTVLLEIGDTFELDGGKYRVDFVFPTRDFQVRAEVMYEGPVV